jgi:hypothetical protein
MMKKIIWAIWMGGLCMLLVSGCGGYKEGMVQPDQESYIFFSGNLEAAVATIDGSVVLRLDEPVEKDPEGKTFYRLKPGKHEVVVTRNGQVIVHRSIAIGSGAAKEIALP